MSDATATPATTETETFTPLVIKPSGDVHKQGEFKFAITCNGKPLPNRNRTAAQGYYEAEAATNAARHLAKKWDRTLMVVPFPTDYVPPAKPEADEPDPSATS